METLYKNVLLLDGKIVNWKMGSTHWNDVDTAFLNRQFVSLFSLINSGRLTVQSTMQEIYTLQEHQAFMEDIEWFKQFEMHEEYSKYIFSPY